MTDNNNFANPLDGDWYGDDRKSNDMDELDEIMRLLDEGDSLPSADGQEEEWPGQTDTDGDRAERARSRQAKSAKPVKNKKDKVKKKEPKKDAGKKEKAPKAKKKDKPKKQEEPADTFGQLPAIKGGKTKSLKEPEESTQPPEEEGKKKKGKGKKEKPPKPPKDPEKVKQNRFTAIVFLVILSLIAIGATVGGYLVTHNGITLPNVYISDIFVGNMSGEEIDAILEEKGWDERVDTELKVKLPADVSFSVDSCLSGAKLSRERAVEAALNYGHDGNWYENLYRFLLNHIGPVDVTIVSQKIDDSYVRECIADGISKLDKATEDDDYEVDEKAEVLRLRKGAGQIQLDEEGLYNQIVAALEAGLEEISYNQLIGTIEMPDFQAIYDELAVEPKDAEFTETFDVVAEVNGCWFDTVEAAELWKAAEPGDIVKIPLKITYPETTAEGLRSMLYRDKLGSQTTYYTWSTENRISNIEKVAEKLNGHIMMPGEVFSYNEYVGQRTAEAGFLEAGAYDNGEVVQEIGGGICQVSSTLYCAIMFAQLETVERTNHYFKVDYLDYGLDATVSWPSPDFKFKNSRDYPVKIVAYCNDEDKSLTIEIWGTDVDGSYVEMRTTKLVVYDSVYVNTAVGYGVSAYRMVYDAEGNFLYEVEEPYGIYYRHDDEIQWPPEKYAADAAAGG
mgnify:CR=1 FL=1